MDSNGSSAPVTAEVAPSPYSELTEAAEPLNSNGNKQSADTKRKSFVAKRFEMISVENPPSKNPTGFACSLLGICCAVPVAGCGLCLVLTVFAIVNCIPIATIVVGALYLAKEYCPSENIAIILIVGGSLTLVQGVMEGIAKIIRTRKGETEDKDMPPFLGLLYSFVRLATFGWFIAACVIVYRLHPYVDFDNKNSGNYCHPVLYLYSFWFLTATWIIVALAVTCVCCGCMVAMSQK